MENRKNENSISIWINLIFKFLDSCCVPLPPPQPIHSYSFWSCVFSPVGFRFDSCSAAKSDHDAAERLCSLRFLHYLFLAGSVRWCFFLAPSIVFARFYILRATPAPPTSAVHIFHQHQETKHQQKETLWEIRNHFHMCHSTLRPSLVFASVSFYFMQCKNNIRSHCRRPNITLSSGTAAHLSFFGWEIVNGNIVQKSFSEESRGKLRKTDCSIH